MKQSFNALKLLLLNWIYPTHCVLCLSQEVDDAMICLNCKQQLPWQQHSCYQCAASFDHGSPSAKLCGFCLANQPFFDHSISAWHYEPPISRYITQLKFNQQLQFAKLLGILLAEHLNIKLSQSTFPQYLIPMPLHHKRLKARGFNQALEIARPISKRLNIPISLQLCSRIKDTLPQIQLDAKKRQHNLRQAFSCNSRVPIPSYVAIIDDVVTTSASVNALSQTLKQHGVLRVEVWSCARAKLVLKSC